MHANEPEMAKKWEKKKKSESLNFLKKGIKAFVSEKMGPEQYHRYMQYVFDTQFNTSDEKKMKKSIIKKINVAQKKKGLPLFKEEDLVDEGFGGELKGKDKEKFEKARKENAEQLGYKLTGKSDIKEAINHPKVQKQAKELAKVLKDVVAAAKKDDRKLARKLVGNIYDIYNDLDWTIQKDLRYKESVKEDLDPYKDFGKSDSWEKEYDLNVGAFVDHYQKFMKVMKKHKVVPDKNKRAWALAIKKDIGQSMFNGYMSQMSNLVNMLDKSKKFEKLKESINEVQKRQATDIAVKFDKAYLNFSREIRDIIKKMVRITGNNTDGKIFDKAYKKHLIPFDALFKSWYKGQQDNPHIKESDLGYTTKKQKVVRAVHKTSGKELIYVDTPSSRKMLKKMGFVVKESVNESVKVRNGEAPMEGKWAVCDISTGKAIKEVGNVRAATRLMNRLMNSGQYKEVAAKWVGEAKSKTIKTIGSIIGKKQAQKIDGVLVDMQTANVIMKVWNALNPSNRKKFEKLSIKKMANVAWKLVK